MKKNVCFVSRMMLLVAVLTGCITNIDQSNVNRIYGVWNPKNSMAGYRNARNELGLFKATYDSLSILQTIHKMTEEKNTRENNENVFRVRKEEIGVIHDIGQDVRIVGITGKYPDITIKFQRIESLLDEKKEYYNTRIDGELIIHFNNENEIWFELKKFNLNKNNPRYEIIMKGLKTFIKFGKENVYVRAEKLVRPIIPDAP